MATKARQQYFADEDSLQKIRREFSIADDIQQKIDSIEEGAQVNKIETVKVNGTALVPDANKAVNVEVPEVIDNLYTVDSDNALSAKQGKLLYDYIQNIASRGRFLSNWNSATGLPTTNPSESPYPYKSGDYFIVSNVAGLGGTNYRPDGSSYIIGQASTVVETDSVDVSDFYFYDGTNWLLLKNSGRSGAVDSALSTTSTNPVENRVITNALNGKQETLIAGNNIQIAADGKTISATDTTYSAGANISIDANNEISATDTTYTAGTNVQISNQNVISATDTKYTAGTGINIDANNVISSTVTSAQWGNITGTLSNQTDLQNALDSKVNLGINKVFDSTVVEIGKWEHEPGGDSSGHHIELDPSGEVSTYNLTTGGHNEATLGSGTLELLNNTVLGGNKTATFDHEKIVADDGTDTETYNFFGNNRIARLSDVGGTYSAGNGIDIDANNEISIDTTVVATQTDLSSKQDTLTAGTNIQIDTTTNTISATDTTYNAGKGIEIGDVLINGRQGPSPAGFHIPSENDLRGLKTAMDSIFSDAGIMNTGDNWRIKLHLPFAGIRYYTNGTTTSQTTAGYYASSTPDIVEGFDIAVCQLSLNSSSVNLNILNSQSQGFSIRAFKDTFETPASSWTVILGTLGSGGIFWNQTDGLISITSNGTTGYTIMDKNLGATVVYSDGDTLSEANCGYYYQRGNDYGFPRTGSVTTSSTQVDASNYGPSNHYSSSTFITGNVWDSSQNGDLWGDITGTYTQGNTITNTGVLSVNGQTGDVIIQTGGNYTAGNGINISNQNIISVDTSVVATQTDVGGMVSKGTNETNSQLFSITDPDVSPQTTAAFGPDFITCGYNNGTSFSGLEPTKTGVVDSSGKTSELQCNKLALKDLTNLTQTTYKEDEITIADNGYGTSETYQFSGGGNNQIARLKDVKTYTAGDGINIDANNEISNTLPGPTIAATAPTGTEGALWYDTTNDVLMAHDGTAWKEAGTQMKVLSYGHSTWQDFIDAYNENAVVYCKASSNSNPGSGNQGRMAFMAFVSVNSGTGVPTSVEFQYYRSRSDHNTQANQLDQVFVYTLTSASGGTWTVTERNTGAKAVAGTGINLAFGSGNMTISADTTTLATQTDLATKQDTLVSGTNIKTVNNQSLLGSGNITISPGETPNVKVFTISGVGDTTTGQQIYDYYEAGNTPLLKYNDVIYKLTDFSTNGTDFDIKFEGAYTFDESSSYSHIDGYTIIIFGANDVVSDVVPASFSLKYLATDSNYMTPYTPQYNGSPATKKYVDDNIITYSAGEGILIGTVRSDMQGPCPDGFHIPTVAEWVGIKNIMSTNALYISDYLTDVDSMSTLHLPKAGYRDGDTGTVNSAGTSGEYWTVDGEVSGSYVLCKSHNIFEWWEMGQDDYYANSIRPFKDEFVAPTNSWTVVRGTLGGAGVFWNQTDGLITITDGTTGYTIADKNLGATTVYNNGDTLSQANCGNFFQRGNNYGFPWTGTVTTSSTQVDASSYGPGNYYSSSTFITSDPRDSGLNLNLWGGVSKGTWIDSSGTTIANTGVLSVNGQTGDVTLPAAEIGLSTETGNVLTAGAKIWTGDETDMPASPNSNTLYFCY